MDIRRVAGWIIVALGVAGGLGVASALLLSFFGRTSGGVLDYVVLVFTLLLALALPLVFLRIGWGLAHPEPIGEVEPRKHLPPVPPPSSDDDVARVPEPVSACPDCGFLGIRMPTMGDGLWPGGGELGDRMVCPRCDWQGLPVRFDTRGEYADYLRELSSGRAGASDAAAGAPSS